MEKERTKISFLWFNLFYCLTYGALAYMGLTLVGIHGMAAGLISVYFYSLNVDRNTTEDYLKYKLEVLEAEINRKLALKKDA